MDMDLAKIHGNPTALQHVLLRGVEQYCGEDAVIVAPTSTAAFMINMFSTLVGKNIEHMTNKLSEESPKRVMSQKQLYRHLSDYDYVDLFSTPAATELSLNILLDQLSSQAPYADETEVYRKLIIPRNTKFFISGYTFSTYYPIQLTYNTKNRMVAAWFDNESHKNPLRTLANDSLETLVYNTRGVDMVSVKLPVYQFDSTIHNEALMPNIPFSKTYTCKNKFYAVRVFTNKTYANSDAFVDKVPSGTVDLGNGNYDTVYEEWTELHQTLDGTMYDPDASAIPTVIVGVDKEFNQVAITIPFIFISQNMLGSKLRIELYDSAGELNIDGTQLKQTEIPMGVTLTGIQTVDKYSILFTRDTDLSVSLIDPAISGGSDGLDFKQVRDRVVYNSFVDKLLVTPLDLTSFFSDYGYRVGRFKDGITRRIYTCHKELRDASNNVIPSGELDTVIDYLHHRDADDPANKVSSILMFDKGNSFMILPNTLFRYDKELNITHPLTDLEKETLFNQPMEEVITQFNQNTYTFTPFHVMMTINNSVPIAKAYDFQFPSVTVTDFKDELVSSTMPGLAIVDSTIEYDNSAEEYNILIDVAVNINNPPPNYSPVDNIRPVLYTQDRYATGKFCVGEYVEEVASGVYRYKFTLGVTFKLKDRYIDITFGSNINTDLLDRGMIPFTPVFDIGLFSDHPDLTSDQSIDYPVAGSILSENAIAISRYEMHTTICSELDYIFNPVDVVYSDKKYPVYEEDVYARYTDYVFSKTNGIIDIDSSTNMPIVEPGKSKGDIIMSNAEYVTYDPAEDARYLGDPENGIPVDLIYREAHNDFVPITEDVLASLEEDEVYQVIRKVLAHRKGDPIITETGNTASRETKYRVSLTHINRRSSLYDEVVTSYGPYVDVADYEQMVRLAIKKHATIVTTVEDRLLPNTEIYYTPSRSIGTALFKASSVLSESHDLEIGISITLHVIRRVISDRVLQNSIRTRIITILDNMLTNEIFSLTEVAEVISDDMSDLILSVDVNGIDGSENIQTMMHIEDGTVLNLKHRIDIVENGRLQLNRDLNLRFVLAE